MDGGRHAGAGAAELGLAGRGVPVGRAAPADPRLAACRVPVLFLVPEADRLVDARAALAVAARMPAAEVVRFGPEAGHEVLREGLAVRDRAFAAIDRFLDRKAVA